MRIATWNVNSVRQRLAPLLDYLKTVAPDVLCLQELKCEEVNFPRLEILDAGYNVEIVAQKSFNGVALISKRPLEDVRRGLPGLEDDPQARYIEGVVTHESGVFRVASIYLPNGNPVASEKYPYKLRFMEALIDHARRLLLHEEPLVLAGDYNVIPEPGDVYDPASWAQDALFLPQTRARYRELLSLGFADALRSVSDAPGLYTFWDYQAGAWQKNKGLRIDHLLLSPQAADRLVSVAIDKHLRDAPKASDHVAIRADFS